VRVDRRVGEDAGGRRIPEGERENGVKYTRTAQQSKATEKLRAENVTNRLSLLTAGTW